jgi:hypothetical protein
VFQYGLATCKNTDKNGYYCGNRYGTIKQYIFYSRCNVNTPAKIMTIKAGLHENGVSNEMYGDTNRFMQV